MKNMKNKRTASVSLIENNTNGHHHLTFRFTDVQSLINEIDGFCDANEIFDVTVEVTCKELTQEECDTLADVWILAIVD